MLAALITRVNSSTPARRNLARTCGVSPPALLFDGRPHVGMIQHLVEARIDRNRKRTGKQGVAVGRRSDAHFVAAHAARAGTVVGDDLLARRRWLVGAGRV